MQDQHIFLFPKKYKEFNLDNVKKMFSYRQTVYLLTGMRIKRPEGWRESISIIRLIQIMEMVNFFFARLR